MSRFGDSREFMNDTYDALMVRCQEVGTAQAFKEYLQILDTFIEYEVDHVVEKGAWANTPTT